MLLVTGANGQFAGWVIANLLEMVGPKGFAVCSRSTDSDRAKDLAAKGVSVREGDFDRPETLPGAMAGIDKVLVIPTYAVNSVRLQQNLNALEAAKAAGVKTLVFTVDMPVPGARYRDAHSGMSGPNAPLRRMLQAMAHPSWAWDVGLLGKPHDLGNISAYRGNPTGLADYIGWLGENFDPSISWKDLEWIREFWDGPMVIKGILDPQDAKDAVSFGADGIVVSNHGGRQLDGVLSSARALPAIADAVKGDLKILADSGIRTGLDVVRMIALGADTVLLGRAFLYALAAAGGAGVSNLLDLIEKEMRVAMVLTGAKSIAEITPDLLVKER